jgi:hypothetical protein
MPNRRIEIKPHRLGYTVILWERTGGSPDTLDVGTWQGLEHFKPTLNQAFGLAIAFMEGDCDIMGI